MRYINNIVYRIYYPCFCVFLTAGIETKAELTKKMETTKSKQQNKINKLTFTLSLDRRGCVWSRFIVLFMVSSGWRSLFIEHHAGPVGDKLIHIQSTIIKYGEN